MKVFVAFPLQGCEGLTVLPDSAVTLPGRPVVLPTRDDGGRWAGLICPAFRIGRLGKAVEPRYGARYVDGITTALLLVAADERSLEVAVDSGWAYDGAVTFGEWLPWQGETAIVDGIDYGQIDIGDLVARVSRYTTIKTGDAILLAPAKRLDPIARTRLALTLGDPPVKVMDKRVI